MACEPRDIPSLNLNACDLGSGYVPKLDSAKNEHINWSIMRVRGERCSLAAGIDMGSIVLLPYLLFKKWNSYEHAIRAEGSQVAIYCFETLDVSASLKVLGFRVQGFRRPD